jgi:hypothetical protein
MSSWPRGRPPRASKIVTVDEPRQGGGSEPVKYLKRDKSKDAPGHRGSRCAQATGLMFKAPAGYELMLQRARHHEQDLFLPNFVSKRRELTGESIANAGH